MYNENMKQKYEVIKFGPNTPMELSCLNIKENIKYWHSNLEILLILKGKLNLVVNDKASLLSEDDIIVINPNSFQELKSDAGCVAISLQINLAELESIDRNIYFNCNSAIDNDKGRYFNLKHTIAQLVKGNSNEEEENVYFNKSIIYSLLYELSIHFKGDNEQREAVSQKYLDRIQRIISYIDNHYKEALTLNTLAEVESLSVPYLSSFFEKHIGVNFMTYYNELRLNRAVHDLLTNDDTVEAIALRNGFPDPRSFVTLFKKKYNTLPSLYRKNPVAKADETFIEPESIEDGKLDRISYLYILSKYLVKPEDNKPSNEVTESKIINKEKISYNQATTNLKHNFKVFTSIGRAKELLLTDTQEMLRELQNEIGYEYIKFHGLLTDDMLVYTEDNQGNAKYSFVYIDKALDFLLSINLKPLIQFSFMPKALASSTDRSVYVSPYYISMPKSMKKWCALIEALTLHLIERYSLKAVKSWLFCCWNEPDTTEHLFGFKNDYEFYSLYKATYNTVKNINKSLIFGSPSLLVSYYLVPRWCRKFINWTKENDCVPDFLNIHYYDNDFSEDTFNTHKPAEPSHSRLNRDENSFAKTIKHIKNLMTDLNLTSIPVYLTEWNLTVSHRNLLNDTCFKSCYLVKNLLENYDELDSFGYWVLTDLIEELQISEEQFHGGLGLYTIDGIKKPHYYAFALVNKLGNKLIEKGDGYFITKGNGMLQIMLYNYEHFNHLFASGETYDMTFTERYTPFSTVGKMDISLEITDLPGKNCVIREHTINQKYGSAFDTWVRMGASKLNNEDIKYIKNISVPRLFVHSEAIKNNSITVNASLDPLEVKLIEIEL